MTALVWALGVGLVLATGAVVTLALLSRKDSRALIAASDLLNGERKVSAEHKHRHETTAAELNTAKDLLEHETNRRAIAEAQRNAAIERVGRLLRQHMPNATNEEIAAPHGEPRSSGSSPSSSRASASSAVSSFLTSSRLTRLKAK